MPKEFKVMYSIKNNHILKEYKDLKAAKEFARAECLKHRTSVFVSLKSVSGTYLRIYYDANSYSKVRYDFTMCPESWQWA